MERYSSERCLIPAGPNWHHLRPIQSFIQAENIKELKQNGNGMFSVSASITSFPCSGFLSCSQGRKMEVRKRRRKATSTFIFFFSGWMLIVSQWQLLAETLAKWGLHVKVMNETYMWCTQEVTFCKMGALEMQNCRVDQFFPSGYPF